MIPLNAIRLYATSIGIADIGFCVSKPFIDYANFVNKMDKNRQCYLEHGYNIVPIQEEFYTPNLHLPGAKTIIALVYPYTLKGNPKDSQADLKVSQASNFRDYHFSVLEQLTKLQEYIHDNYSRSSVIYTDTGPLNDKSILIRTGLAKLGRNNLLIHPKFGSRFYIGYLITDLECEGAKDETLSLHPYCEKCRKCQSACPNNAILGLGEFNSQRCISFLTQSKTWEHMSEFTLDGYIYGCDTCQLVCPLNGLPLKEYEREELVSSRQSYEDVMNRTNKEFKALLGETSAGWIGNKRFKRNAQYNRKDK